MTLDIKRTIETDFAMQAEQKFRFYFLSLIFTLLALSVQTLIKELPVDESVVVIE